LQRCRTACEKPWPTQRSQIWPFESRLYTGQTSLKSWTVITTGMPRSCSGASSDGDSWW
jgi:hypothetical protein